MGIKSKQKQIIVYALSLKTITNVLKNRPIKFAHVHTWPSNAYNNNLSILIHNDGAKGSNKMYTNIVTQ